MCKSKIHRAVVTEANLEYRGSITIDRKLMEAADLYPYERVQIANLTNGSRLETYVIEGPPDSGVICVNGAAAHHAAVNDEIHIISYALLEDSKAREIKPKIIHLNKQNRIIRIEEDQAVEV